jgi:ribosomal protein S18 acetylase RimI-like enzyme
MRARRSISSVYEIRPLTGVGWDELATGFNAGFADYVVPMTIDAAGLEAMQRRRGYVASASFGAFEGTRLVGFVLTCIDGDLAYNSGTGIVPEHRRGGLARRLLDEVVSRLEARRYVLEVIETNAWARALYRHTGFVESRGLQSWMLPHPTARHPAAAPVPEAPDLDLDALVREADAEPSWQNSLAAVRRATEPYVVLGDETAAAVVFPASADVPFFCVRRDARRRGHGRKLLLAAAQRTTRPLRVVNVDERARGIASFLEAIGATRWIRQVEMVRELR